MTKKSSLLTSSVSPTIIDKGDSAPSSHYLCEEDKQCLKNIKPFHGPPTLLPDNSTITADKKVLLPLSEELSPEAQTTMMLPNLKSASLISIGQLCDDNYDGSSLQSNKHLSKNCIYQVCLVVFFLVSFDQDIKYLFPNFGYSLVVTGLLIYYHWEAMLVSYLATRFVCF